MAALTEKERAEYDAEQADLVQLVKQINGRR